MSIDPIHPFDLLPVGVDGAPKKGLTTITWEQFENHWQTGTGGLAWDCLFMLPPWLKAWSGTLAQERGRILAVYDRLGGLMGLVPLAGSRKGVYLWGDPEVCDFLDLICAPGRAPEVLETLLIGLRQLGIRELRLGPLVDTSPTLTAAASAAGQVGVDLQRVEDTPVYALTLPGTWEAYLASLKAKQRHEVRRKRRRLNDHGQVRYRVHTDLQAVERHLPLFFKLFAANRSDKARFMNPDMRAYFEQLCLRMAAMGYLRLGLLYLDQLPVAATLCFDDGHTLYLYNNGYDQQYQHLSVGMLSKVMSIADGIDIRRRGYSFLKGNEPYKRHLGGHPLELARLTFDLR